MCLDTSSLSLVYVQFKTYLKRKYLTYETVMYCLGFQSALSLLFKMLYK